MSTSDSHGKTCFEYYLLLVLFILIGVADSAAPFFFPIPFRLSPLADELRFNS